MIDKLLFRSHSCGDLMGAKGLGKVGEKRARYTYLESTTGRTHTVKNKYMTKGLENEQDAIEMVCRVFGKDYVKNAQKQRNDYLIGECDINSEDGIHDIKNCWDLYTFDDASNSDATDYEWQCRAYMELFNKDVSSVIYCLTDASDSLVMTELEKAGYKYNGDLPDSVAIDITINMIFTKQRFNEFLEFAPIDLSNNYVKRKIETFVEIPEKNRVKKFEFKRDNELTDKLYSRVTMAREYLKTIYK